MLLSLAAHGTSERRCVGKFVFALSHMQHSVRLTPNPGAFSPVVWSHCSAEQNILQVVGL